MSKPDQESINISENEMIDMLNETSKLVVRHNFNQLSSAAVAVQGSNSLSNNVEFWKWMGRNYSGSGIFDSSSTMQQYIAQGTGKEEWIIKQLQGKGYEWDWMSTQRRTAKNILKTYDAGDVANRAASDVTAKNLLTGKSSEYQMKAYTSKSNPHLNNTPKDMTVVTNAEKVDVVRANGYEKVEGFQDTQMIKKSTEERLEQIKDGKAYTSYNFKNIAGTMAKAGLIGCVIGMGTEAVVSYKAWKQGQLSDEEYLKEILKSGGDAGVTAGATAGVMIPVSAAITAVGASTLLTIPVAFIVGGVVNKVVAPCFGRGQYREILSKAKYYQNIENVYDDLVGSMQHASEQYYDFVCQMSQQNAIHQEFKKRSMEMNQELKDLFDSI
ncbi:hypothetical protein [Paenibacillus thalictri]|uniref:Uncharacterized protein n=1 Tax=Paenibacillus thalictri TaxID=2527873 RepID=A0A4Q9DVS0_9BACL|nr:hypothetical protein [Paenibacillus thalictri]TBL79091.1 hypothetical protein EYB31_12795 [Paenibacillus thalictri]